MEIIPETVAGLLEEDRLCILFVTILGGATAAADLAISSWTREAQQIQISMLSTLGDVTANTDYVASICDRAAAQHAAQEQRRRLYDPSIILPKDNNAPSKFVKKEEKDDDKRLIPLSQESPN